MRRNMLPATILALFLFTSAVSAAPSPVTPTKITASSVLPPSKSGSYDAENVLSPNLSTAWVKGTPGTGVGEWLEFSFDKAEQFSAVRICNGYQKSQGIYNNNSRVKTLSLVFSNGESQRFDLDDKMGCFDYSLAGESDRVKLVVEAVYPGAKWQDLALSHIQFFSPVQSASASQQPASAQSTAASGISEGAAARRSEERRLRLESEHRQREEAKRQDEEASRRNAEFLKRNEERLIEEARAREEERKQQELAKEEERKQWELAEQERAQERARKQAVEMAEAQAYLVTDIELIKSCYYPLFPASEGYPTIGKAFDKAFKKPTWTIKTMEGGGAINEVTFTGIYESKGGPAKFVAVFQVHSGTRKEYQDERAASPAYVEVNGQVLRSYRQLISQVFLNN